MDQIIRDKLNKAKQLEIQQDWNQATTLYKELYEITQKTDYLNKIAYIYSQLKEHKQAIAYYKKYLEIEKEDWTAYYNLAIEYFYVNEWNHAIESLKNAIHFKKDFTKSYLFLGYIYELQNNFKEAIQQFNFVLKQDPHNKIAIKGTIYSLMQLKEYEKALNICEHFLKIFKDDLMLKNLHAGILFQLGKSDAFIQELKEITEKDNNYKSFENYLNKLKNDRREEQIQFLEEVQKKLIQKSIELEEKKDTKTYLDLSILSLFSGNKENALEYLKKAMETKKQSD